MSGLIETTQRMAGLCRKRTEITLIDTTGLVSGDLGKALKTGKIRAVEPDWVIALQKGDELEHLLSVMDDFRIIRIRSSSEVKARSMAERFRYRNRKLEDYFSGPAISEFILRRNEVRFIFDNKPFDPKEEDLKEGMIIGLNHDEDTLALGLVAESHAGSITFSSPLKSIKKIRSIVLGDMILQKNMTD
jgi:polynucleotide 5'-hydroxyl-kinase GRC3/NOL9